MVKVNLVIEKDDDGFYGYSPDLEGCMTQGKSYNETLSNLKEAVGLYLSTMDEDEIKQLINRDLQVFTQEFDYV